MHFGTWLNSPHVSIFFFPAYRGASKHVEMLHLSFEMPLIAEPLEGSFPTIYEYLYVTDESGSMFYSAGEGKNVA